MLCAVTPRVSDIVSLLPPQRSRTRHLTMADLSLPTPDSFPAFPFLPYEIQLDLMRHLYENIESRRVTIVESPTGTVSSTKTVSSHIHSHLGIYRERLLVYYVPPSHGYETNRTVSSERKPRQRTAVLVRACGALCSTSHLTHKQMTGYSHKRWNVNDVSSKPKN